MVSKMPWPLISSDPIQGVSVDLKNILEVSIIQTRLVLSIWSVTDLLELPHVGSVHAEGGEERARLLQHPGPVHQAGQRDTALQSDVVVQLHNNYINTTLQALMNRCLLKSHSRLYVSSESYPMIDRCEYKNH